MGSAPLPPLRNPLETLAALGVPMPSGGLATLILGLVFAAWLIYTLVVTYHWLRYSHASVIAYPAIFTHLVVSIAIMSYALGGSPVPTLL